jgi:urease accessory protein
MKDALPTSNALWSSSPERGDVSLAQSPHLAAPTSAGWTARLALRFARRDDRTVLVTRTHSGPLVVQKTLHPEGPGVCQAIVVHPPGGIAGGDQLALSVDVGINAHAQLTTPGATKWYRSTGVAARQTLDFCVEGGATCEWLPQDGIVFDGARAEMTTRVALTGDAVFMGWDLTCLGRIASGERFERGAYRQRFELMRDNATVWAERAIIDADSAVATSPVGLSDYPIFGTFVIAAPMIADELLVACRRITPDRGEEIEGAVTRLPGVLVARCRGHSVESARRWFVALWTVLRPALCGRQAMPPRIWNS